MLMSMTPVTLIVSFQGMVSKFYVTNNSAHDSGTLIVSISGTFCCMRSPVSAYEYDTLIVSVSGNIAGV